jgi:HEAT repeat protein
LPSSVPIPFLLNFRGYVVGPSGLKWLTLSLARFGGPHVTEVWFTMNDLSHDDVIRLAGIAFQSASVIDSHLARIAVAAAAASGKLETLVIKAVAGWSPNHPRHLFEQLIVQGHAQLACSYLSHPKFEVRRAVLKEIARTDDVSCLPSVRARAEDPDGEIRQLAAQVARRLETMSPRDRGLSPHRLDQRDNEILTLLLDCPVPLESVVGPLFSSNQLSRQEVLRVLLPMAVAVAPALIAYLENTRPAISSAVQELLAAAKNPRGLTWLADAGGINALAQIGDPWAADVIVDLAVNADRHSLDTAMGALARMGPVGAAAVKRVLDRGAVSPNVGEMAGQVCGAEITPTLIALLGHRDADNRNAAIQGLVKQGETAIDAVAALLDAENERIRRDALHVLVRGQHNAAVAWILATWRVRTSEDQQLLIDALAHFNEWKALEALAQIYETGSPDIRLDVVKSLGHYAFASIRPQGGLWFLLMQAISDSNTQLREAAAKALRFTHPDEVGSDLDRLLDRLISMQADEESAATAAADVLGLWWADDRQVRRSMRIAVNANEGRVRDRLQRLIENAERKEREQVRIEGAGTAAGADDLSSTREWEGEPTLPQPITDAVWFSVTAPVTVAAGTMFVIDVWAHERSEQRKILRIAQSWAHDRAVRYRSQGPRTLRRGAELTVVVRIDGLTVAEPVATLLWIGTTANCSFAVTVPPAIGSGCRVGTVQILLGPLRMATVHFEVEVGRAASEYVTDVAAVARWVRSAFASYASEDRPDVVARIQGMQKLAPHLDVFLDVVSLRSGEAWKKRVEEEVASRDTFYLFWSVAASRSPWVDAEWRLALSNRGLAYIDPVPLESPSVAPPPQELASLHFSDWTIELWRAASFS